jgi:hypothetical protein
MKRMIVIYWNYYFSDADALLAKACLARVY